MSRIESAETIEATVGAKRHAVDHIGRAVSAEQRLYILHSERCRAQYEDLRQCPYSLALDRGIDVSAWAGFEDRPVKLWIRVKTLRLMPAHIGTAVHPGPGGLVVTGKAICDRCASGIHPHDTFTGDRAGEDAGCPNAVDGHECRCAVKLPRTVSPHGALAAWVTTVLGLELLPWQRAFLDRWEMKQ